MDKPLVSVVVAAYNIETYLSDCLDSVLAQDYENLELIVVDDASTDNTASIIENYKQKDRRVRMLRQTKNSGPSAVRNAGMDLSKGKYILFVDGDDLLCRNLLSETVSCAEKHELDEVIFGFKVFTEGQEWKWQERELYANDDVPASILSGRNILALREKLLKTTNDTIASWTVWSRLYNRSFLVRNNLRFLEDIHYEDVLFLFQCCLKSSRVMMLGEKLYFYRKNSGSITTSWNNKRAKSLISVMSLIYADWVKGDFTTEENKAIGEILRHLYTAYLKAEIRGETGEFAVSPAVDFCYKLLHGQLPYKYGKLTEESIRCLKDKENILVYGAGGAAAEVFEQLRRAQLKIMGVMVTHKEGNPASFGGSPVKTLEEWGVVENATVIIAVSSKYSNGIEQKLRQFGYQQIVNVQEIDVS